MNDYAKKYERIERKEFKLADWKELFERAKRYRATCGWDADAEYALRLRKNDLPLRNIQGLPQWKGKIYRDNWLWKIIKLQVSMLTGSDLQIDLRGYTGVVTPAQDLLEQEVNYAHDAFDFTSAYEDALYDAKYCGLGWIRCIWNTRKPTPNYPTGTPLPEYVDALNMYVDPATRQRDMSDCRYLFHEDYMDLYQLYKRYPKYRDKLAETIDNRNPEPTNRVRIVTLQYRRTIDVEKVYIEDRDTGAKSDFLLDEWTDYIDKQRDLPETQALYEQYVAETEQMNATNPLLEEEVLDFGQWLMEGGSLPEKVVMIGAIEVEEDAVYQAIFLPDHDIVLEQPQYVGKKFTYFRLVGIPEPDRAYPGGLPKYQGDLQEASTIIMTILLVQAVKTYKNEKLIAEDSLVNQETYQERGYEIGMNPIVKDEWQLRHPGQKAVEYMKLPEFPTALSYLNDQIINAQKTFGGATDAMMGLQSYAGDSGIKVAQLQAASRTYTREDVENFRRFVTQTVEWLKEAIVMYRNYPHQIQGLDHNDRPGMVDVSTDIVNKLSADNYYAEITIQDNQEVVKQMEREIATSLFDRGLLAPVELLRQLDRPNPEKTIEDAEIYRGEQQALEILRQFPEAQQILQQFAQQAQMAKGQPAQTTK